MCGRYVSVASDPDLTLEFDVEETVDEAPPPSYNVAPTDPARIVVERRPHDSDTGAGAATVHQLRTARWGLVPSWSKDAKGGARMINARIETVTGKPAFKRAAAARRCLVPALGYYEWKQTEGGKVPYFLHDPGGALVSFAGLYEFWRDPARGDEDPARWLVSYTIITQQATDLLGEIHDRNPVVVPRELREQWLDCASEDAAVAERLLGRFGEAHFEPYEVGAAVGNVRNNGPELIAPVEPAPQQQVLDL